LRRPGRGDYERADRSRMVLVDMSHGPISALEFVAHAVAPVVVPFAVFGLLERWRPAGRHKTAGGWSLNVQICLLYLAVPTILGGVIAALVALIRQHNGGGLIDLGRNESRGIVASLIGSLLFLLIWDFFYYWWHRAQHECPLLWRMHKLHHMDETLGVTTEMRCHWLEEIGRVPTIVVPMALIFNLPVHAGVVAVVLTTWSAFIHSNLRLSFGRWSVALAGPQVHRIHHSIEQHHFDKNYAAFFPMYDWMFGSFYKPATNEYPETGVRGEEDVRSLWQAAILPLRAPAHRTTMAAELPNG
jgi:sterol desaturase/sphingolipid hydroxylase (fatty acid hydroxylase superfamily)